MTSLTLGDGSVVKVVPPDVPGLKMGPPTAAGVALVPVAGPPGPAGDVSGLFYEHVQTLAQSVWTIPHNLGHYPTAWSLFDNTGRLCDEYEVQHLDLNTSRVSMDVPTAGLIRLI